MTTMRVPAALGLAILAAGCALPPDMERSVAAPPAAGPTVGYALQAADVRPISDFLDRQGTFCTPDGAGGCITFVPPVRNFLGVDNVLDGLKPQDPAEIRFGSLDYAGLAERWLRETTDGAATFGTTSTGTVTERPLPDGRAEVHVDLHTRNALTWVVAPVADGDDNPYAPNPFPPGASEVLFGYRADDLVNATNDGLRADRRPGLSDVHYRVWFINTAPGAPLPDLNQLLSQYAAPGTEFQSLWVQASGTGPLRTAGDEEVGITVTQTGNIHAGVRNGFKGAFQDGFPVERIEFRGL